MKKGLIILVTGLFIISASTFLFAENSYTCKSNETAVCDTISKCQKAKKNCEKKCAKPCCAKKKAIKATEE